MRCYFVYILGNERGTIYTGITNDIHRRMQEHKNGTFKGFTRKYKIHRLLYVEEFNDVYQALEAEKIIKGWIRKKKMDLIRSMNPKFQDLSEDWS